MRGLLLDHQVGRAAAAGPKSGSSRAWGLIRQVGQILVPLEWGDRGRGATDSGGDTVDVGFPQSRSVVGAGSSQGVPIRAEGHRSDAAGVAGQGAKRAGMAQSRISHNRTVLSELAVARVRPCGLKVTEFTAPAWPVRVASRLG